MLGGPIEDDRARARAVRAERAPGAAVAVTHGHAARAVACPVVRAVARPVVRAAAPPRPAARPRQRAAGPPRASGS